MTKEQIMVISCLWLEIQTEPDKLLKDFNEPINYLTSLVLKKLKCEKENIILCLGKFDFKMLPKSFNQIKNLLKTNITDKIKHHLENLITFIIDEFGDYIYEN